jgi:hypothetical protein
MIAEAQFVSYGINAPWYVQVGVLLLAVEIILTFGRNLRAKNDVGDQRK